MCVAFIREAFEFLDVFVLIMTLLTERLQGSNLKQRKVAFMWSDMISDGGWGNPVLT